MFREVSCYVGVGAFGDAARWVHLLPEDRENGEDYRYYRSDPKGEAGGRANGDLSMLMEGGEKESLLVPYINQRGRGKITLLSVKGKQFGGRCDHRLGKGCRTLKLGGGGGLTNEVVVGEAGARACVVCLGFQSERLCSLFTCGEYERSTSEGFFFLCPAWGHVAPSKNISIPGTELVPCADQLCDYWI